MNNNDPVLFVWVCHVNDMSRNRLYSAYLSDIYYREDPFQYVTLLNTTPCWMR